MGIEISKKELDELRDAQARLSALEAGGVDNWEWYDEALKDYHKQKEQEENINALIDDICCIACENVEEPAGRGCGYGIRQNGYDKIERLIKEFLKKEPTNG